ncbi:MAG TPA: DUF6526 family protein [Bryobacteraceae bacterium]|nr:DUF6526 family protein [Bryobacteraceae bacterium]
MPNSTEQNFKNHAKLVPLFHFVALPILLVNTIWRLVQLKNGITFDSIMEVLVAVALVAVALTARTFALTVQNRVIRLEMELRLAKLLPAAMQPRIGEFTIDQLIALRFASDAELPALAQQVLDEKLTSRADIKGRVKNWRADLLRA